MKLKASYVRGGILLTVLGCALLLERKRPLRAPTQSKLNRMTVNFGFAAVAAVLTRPVFNQVLYRAAKETERRNWGLMPRLNAPRWARSLLTVLLMDLTLYYWHKALHRMPLFWRFHKAHHIDLDLDVSTASRFHFGELFFAAFFHSLQVIVIGVSRFDLAVYTTAMTAFAQFHHSNVRLPLWFEKRLNKGIVTPRMHGVHHSTVRNEADSNYGTIFSFWDRAHKTLKLNIRQNEIVVGVPSYLNREGRSLFKDLMVPFKPQQSGKLPMNHEPVRRANLDCSPSEMVP